MMTARLRSRPGMTTIRSRSSASPSWFFSQPPIQVKAKSVRQWNGKSPASAVPVRPRLRDQLFVVARAGSRPGVEVAARGAAARFCVGIVADAVGVVLGEVLARGQCGDRLPVSDLEGALGRVRVGQRRGRSGGASFGLQTAVRSISTSVARTLGVVGLARQTCRASSSSDSCFGHGQQAAGEAGGSGCPEQVAGVEQLADVAGRLLRVAAGRGVVEQLRRRPCSRRRCSKRGHSSTGLVEVRACRRRRRSGSRAAPRRARPAAPARGDR